MIKRLCWNQKNTMLTHKLCSTEVYLNLKGFLFELFCTITQSFENEFIIQRYQKRLVGRVDVKCVESFERISKSRYEK
jgi:hypothetical protein